MPHDKFDPTLVSFVEKKIAGNAYSVMPHGWYNSFAVTAIEAVREWDSKDIKAEYD